MAIRASIMGLVALVGASLLFTPLPAFAAPIVDRCRDGTAPAGWLRPGGYCEIAGDLNQHSGSSPGGSGGGCAGDTSQDLVSTVTGHRLHLTTHCDGSYDGVYGNGVRMHSPTPIFPASHGA
jgi:hypothetical protein